MTEVAGHKDKTWREEITEWACCDRDGRPQGQDVLGGLSCGLMTGHVVSELAGHKDKMCVGRIKLWINDGTCRD